MRSATIITFSLLAACKAGGVPSQTPPQPDTDPCGSKPLQHLIGGDAGQIELMEFSDPVRIIQWNSAVTMDFNPNRLNVVVDQDSKVGRIYCG